MRYRFSAGMAEVTRLTREGRVADATALIQALLRPHDSTETPTSMREPAKSAHQSEVLDLVPPSVGSEHWSIPNAGPGEADLNSTATFPSEHVQETTRGLREPFQAYRFNPAMQGLAARFARTVQLTVPPGARFEEHTFANDAGSRKYKLYVPSCYIGEPLPLVVMLHGCKQSPDDFATGTRMNELAEEARILVAYPEQPSSANTARCWNWFNAGDQMRDAGEPSLIAGITRQILDNYAGDAARAYVAGLSAGGAAAAIMGATYPDLYAAICVHSGLPCGVASDLPSAFAAMRQGGTRGINAVRACVPAIVFHSDCDTVVSPRNGEQVITQSAAGFEFRRTVNRGKSEGGIHYTRTVHSDKDGFHILEHWLLHGLGHAWSGGSSAGSYTDPRGPDASRETLRFFLAHSKVPNRAL
jgi:poly(hydroxyalkanoate) depolymerase family esterase